MTETTGAIENAAMQKQLDDMQKLLSTQLQIIQAQQAVGTQNQPALLTQAAGTVKRIDTPSARYDMSAHEFRTYKKDCTDFKKLTGYSDEQTVLQMRIHMDATLKQAIDANYSETWDTSTVKEALEKIETLLKKVSNPVVHRKTFDELTQNSTERFTEFITRLKICASDCDFQCPFEETHNLTEYHLINRIRSGVRDKALQQELLQKSSTLNTLIAIVEHCTNYESAKDDSGRLKGDTLVSNISDVIEEEQLCEEEVIAAISNYKKSKKAFHEQQHQQQPHQQHDETKLCHNCGFEWPHANGQRSCPARNNICKICKIKGHYEKLCKKRKSKGLSSIIIGAINRIKEFSKSQIAQLPKLSVKAGHDNELETIETVADTGAQVTVGGPAQMRKLKIKKKSLLPPPHDLKHVGGKKLDVMGYYPIFIHHNSKLVEVDVYFTNEVNNMYLSLDVCKKICIIDENFPLNNTDSKDQGVPNINAVQDANNVPQQSLEQQSAPSVTLPEKPSELPFPAREDQLDNFEQYFLDTFKNTTFKVEGELATMKGEPATIHIHEDAPPHSVTTPIPIPHHWKKKYKDIIEKNIKAGILRRAPENKPTRHCAQMVPTAKKNQEPRLTVDYRALNAHCERTPHHTPRPFDIISSIPTHTFKTVLDAYNGYHQILLDEDSVELTTFITEFGRLQSLRAPQGFSGSGDIYTRRYDDIISDVPRKGKIVDDTLLYDSTITEAFHHTFDYLKLCAENGITLNPKKFRFCRREVEFCGYLVGWEGFRPCDEMISAIKNFPMPDEPTITDIRAWFGVVNQLAPFIANAEIMSPFRDLLKSKNLKGKKVYWDATLRTAFENSKTELCDIAMKGLHNYDLNRKTVLVTDWSKKGIGFTLLQKHCSCKDDSDPTCCEGGWKLVYCNSRTLHKEEADYVPVEGEGLAVTWALKKARMFLQGHPKFTILVDQRPLTKIFGDKPLADIENIRLQKQKIKTFPYNFDIKYIEGVKNHANTFSRYPVNKPDSEDILEAITINAIEYSVTVGAIETTLAITADELKQCAAVDDQYQHLLTKVSTDSFSDNISLEEPSLKEYHNVRDRLSIVDGALMYSFEDNIKRFVIPKNLRQRVLKNLHSANQGSTSMLARARKSW